MSERRYMIELSAPVYYNFNRSLRESKVVRNLECGYCNGGGNVLREDKETDEWGHYKCPVCKGSGQLDAYVTIEWRPSARRSEP